MYIFYWHTHQNYYGVGKLSNINNHMTFQLVYNVTLPGHITMALVRRSELLLYYILGSEMVLSSVSLSLVDQQIWPSLPTLDDASPLIFGSNNSKAGDYVLYDIAWNEYLSQYVLLATKDSIVSVWYSPTPFGPFTQQKLPQLQQYNSTHTYFRKELWRDHGRIMIFTYCINGSNGGSLPHLAEIEYCTIPT